MQNRLALRTWIDGIVLLSIFVSCILYSLFISDFAEIHVIIPSLNFPIFWGELLLTFCSTLILIKVILFRDSDRKVFLIGLFYLGWIVFMSIAGYIEYGPLSLRHAALFYYALFAFVAYEAFRIKLFNKYLLQGAAILLVGFLLTDSISIYFRYLYFCLIGLIIFQKKSEPWFWVVSVLCGLTFLFKVQTLLGGGRAHFLGLIIAISFVLISFGIIKAKKNFLKIIILFGITGLLIGIMFKMHPQVERMKTMLDLSGIKEAYSEPRALVDEKRADYKPRDYEPKLYRSNTDEKVRKEKLKKNKEQYVEILEKMALDASGELNINFKDASKEGSIELKRDPREIRIDSAQDVIFSKENGPKYVKLDDDTAFPYMSLEEYERNETIKTSKSMQIKVAYNNIIYRLFIWGDMLEELKEVGYWRGVGFGRPQRSISMEILKWADEDLTMDGWITPHNAFLHMFYRAGVIGVILALGLLTSLGFLTVSFIKLNSFKGVILLSTLIYWLVSACFGVVLELPYQAIPFWSILGCLFAYKLVLQAPSSEN